jgi:hypothetical protein
MDRVAINEEVNVTSVYFANKNNLKSFPKCMEYKNEEYTFVEGLQYLVHKGKQAVRLFDMTDGLNKYRLKFDTEAFTWTLLSISPEPRAL